MKADHRIQNGSIPLSTSQSWRSIASTRCLGAAAPRACSVQASALRREASSAALAFFCCGVWEAWGGFPRIRDEDRWLLWGCLWRRVIRTKLTASGAKTKVASGSAYIPFNDNAVVWKLFAGARFVLSVNHSGRSGSPLGPTSQGFGSPLGPQARVLGHARRHLLQQCSVSLPRQRNLGTVNRGPG